MVVSKIFYFHPYLGKIAMLTNIFQRGWNHQLVQLDMKKPFIFPHNSANTSCTLIGGSKETNKIWSYPTISHGFVGYFLSLRLMLQKSKGPTLRLDVTKKTLVKQEWDFNCHLPSDSTGWGCFSKPPTVTDSRLGYEAEILWEKMGTGPWKINGWNLQKKHLERKMIWTKPPWF